MSNTSNEKTVSLVGKIAKKSKAEMEALRAEKFRKKQANFKKHGIARNGKSRVFPSNETPFLERKIHLSTLKNEITGAEIPVFQTAESERMEAANRMISLVIRRIEFPKWGERFEMSIFDRADARASGMLACVEFGFFEHGKAGLPLLRKIRSAIQSKDCLLYRAKRESYTAEIEKLSDEIGYCHEEENFSKKLSPSQVTRARQIMATLKASKELDESRKRESNFQAVREFFILTLSHLTGRAPRAMSANNYSKKKTIFKDYLKRGATSAKISPSIRKIVFELSASLEENFMATR